jgi:adenosylcobinamide-GDP ribazoletransferase
VGAIVGVAVGGIAAGLAELVPMAVAAAVAVLAGVALTGAFHEDGLADTADAAGGWSREQRVAILDDPRHGSYGVAALAGSLLLRTVAVAALAPAAAFAGLVAAHTLGRGAAVVVLGVVPAARPEGLGAEYASAVGRRRVVAGAMAALAIAALATGWWAAPLAVAAAVGAVVVAAWARRALGGVSGDVLGAVEQVAECLVLVVVTGLATRHAVWWS